MDLLLLGIYAAVCIAAFKAFKIPLNKWTVPTAVLGGLVFVGAIVMVMNYNHPYAKLARNFYITTPVISDVNGRVISVPVQPNQPLKKGDVLFEVDPTPFRATVESLRAQLAAAEPEAAELVEELRNAIAGVNQAKASRDQSKDAYTRYKQGYDNARAFSERDVEARRLSLEQAEAALDRAEASEREARLHAETKYMGQHPEVARLQAELQKAMYNLEHTVVRAPTDGYVTQVFLQPGMYVAALPLRPVMVFVHDDPVHRNTVVGAFWQNSLQRIKAGDEAEVIFDGVPGEVFKARVKQALPALSQGQLQASGELLSVESRYQPGFVPVELEIVDERFFDYHLPGGVVASAAIYTHHAHHMSTVRKVLLRMQGWMNYFFPFH